MGKEAVETRNTQVIFGHSIGLDRVRSEPKLSRFKQKIKGKKGKTESINSLNKFCCKRKKRNGGRSRSKRRFSHLNSRNVYH